jgi:hypothetical protein
VSSGKKQDDNDFDQYFIDDKRVDKETWMKHNRDYQRTLPAILQRLGIQRDREREKLAKEFLALELAAKLGSAFRSFPSTAAVSDTLVTSGSQSLSQYNVPQDAITRIAQEQAKQVVEKNIVPLIEETAKHHPSREALYLVQSGLGRRKRRVDTASPGSLPGRTGTASYSHVQLRRGYGA